MRRIDIEPTEQVIDNALADDPTGRRDELKEFVRILDSIEGNFSIFIDGEWGSGKTFFIKEVERLLTLMNINSGARPCENGSIEALCKTLEEYGVTNSHLAIYFNAWEYDYCNNPIEPLVEVVVESFHELAGLDKDCISIGEKAAELLRSLKLNLSAGGFGAEIDFEKVVDAFKGDSQLQDFRGKREIRTKLKDLLDTAKEGRANRIVLFVDELDRCRPEYAIRTLETLKFLFDQDYLTLVFSVNANALGASVSSWYGGGFNGSRYLMRFYDAAFRFRDNDVSPYLSSLGFQCYSTEDFILRYARRKDVTFRDINRWMEAVRTISLSNDYQTCENSLAAIVCMRIIVPGAVIFSTLYPDKRNSLYNGSDISQFRDWLLEDPLYVENILSIPSEYFDQEKDRSAQLAFKQNSDGHMNEAAFRLDILCRIVFGKEKGAYTQNGMYPPKIGSVYVSQLRKTARRALML